MRGGTMTKIQTKLKPIPQFKNEDEEREFWWTHDTTEYFDLSKPIKLDLSHLKFSTQSVTVRLPISLLSDLRRLANKRDVPYQSLMKILLAQKVNEELKKPL